MLCLQAMHLCVPARNVERNKLHSDGCSENISYFLSDEACRCTTFCSSESVFVAMVYLKTNPQKSYFWDHLNETKCQKWSHVARSPFQIPDGKYVLTVDRLAGETKGPQQQEPRPPALYADTINCVLQCRRSDSVIMEKSGSCSRPLWEFQLTAGPRTKLGSFLRTSGLRFLVVLKFLRFLKFLIVLMVLWFQRVQRILIDLSFLRVLKLLTFHRVMRNHREASTRWKRVTQWQAQANYDLGVMRVFCGPLRF